MSVPPARVFVAFAVSAAFVGFEFNELFEGRAVLFGAVGACWHSPGHDDVVLGSTGKHLRRGDDRRTLGTP